MATFGYDEQREVARSLGPLVKDAAAREPFLEAVKQFPDAKMRSTIIDDVIDDWSKIDPVSAAAWLDTVGFDNEMLEFRPAAELAENWFERDPRAAVDWLWNRTPEHMRNEFVDDFVRREWGRQDPPGAKAWLEANGFDTISEK